MFFYPGSGNPSYICAVFLSKIGLDPDTHTDYQLNVRHFRALNEEEENNTFHLQCPLKIQTSKRQT